MIGFTANARDENHDLIPLNANRLEFDVSDLPARTFPLGQTRRVGFQEVQPCRYENTTSGFRRIVKTHLEFPLRFGSREPNDFAAIENWG